MDCIFCKIANGEIPTEMIYEDDTKAVFKDLNPQAPVHLLVIPKEHISSNNEIDSENKQIVGEIFELIKNLAREMNFDKNGYRIVNNCGNDGGQTVKHLHYHVLAGRNLNWPPG
ncbi:MAG: histidine triad nucleotide-binding protein [Tissierellia bacterium]|nr:histidine triad nucleotide-binding protein [Tissierellia bacterium]